ncbi:hypothetical protein [Jiangella asiatica]|uniref:Uncharacterized protein n=1 Tax=Jiangella asiatica TaxID=2530372 RepID=A0A4R5D5N4_9ACTN|nr:hypothetical protein [Jiangella asiatica]TDE08789.1 hypothetical protein E1269_16635 [Jiangella asiatica]
MTTTDVTTADVKTADLSRTTDGPDFRSTEMHLMNEALARAHCTEQLELAKREQRVRRIMAARRMDRRAARAAQRASRLASAAVAMRTRTY